MTFADAIFCIPQMKVKIIQEQTIFTSQELMNETKFDNAGSFNLHCGAKQNSFVITKDGEPFAFTV